MVVPLNNNHFDDSRLSKIFFQAVTFSVKHLDRDALVNGSCESNYTLTRAYFKKEKYLYKYRLVFFFFMEAALNL